MRLLITLDLDADDKPLTPEQVALLERWGFELQPTEDGDEAQRLELEQEGDVRASTILSVLLQAA